MTAVTYRCCVHCERGEDGVCIDAPDGNDTHTASCSIGGRHDCPSCDCARCDGTKRTEATP